MLGTIHFGNRKQAWETPQDRKLVVEPQIETQVCSFPLPALAFKTACASTILYNSCQVYF